MLLDGRTDDSWCAIFTSERGLDLTGGLFFMLARSALRSISTSPAKETWARDPIMAVWRGHYHGHEPACDRKA